MIVDDHELVRSGLESTLLLFDDIELVAQVGSGEAAVRACEATQPDVVLMDLVMPGMSGTEATRRILERCPRAAWWRLPASRRRSDRGRVARGSHRLPDEGYLRSRAATAIRAASAGVPTLGLGRLPTLMHAVASPDVLGKDLTPRERQVLDHLSQRAEQQRDCRSSRHQPVHGQEAREQRHHQAGRIEPHRGGHDGGAPPSRVAPRTLTAATVPGSRPDGTVVHRPVQ